MSVPVADRKRMVATLVDHLMEANRRDIAALERQGWPGIPEVPVGDMEIHCGRLIDSLIKADLFREEATVKAEVLEEAASQFLSPVSPLRPGASALAASWLQGRASRLLAEVAS